MYTNNHDVFVQFETKKPCKVFKNQLNCTSPDVVNLPVFNVFKLYEKYCGYLLIIYRVTIGQSECLVCLLHFCTELP